MKQIKAYTFDEVLELARKKAAEFEALPPEEKAEAIRKRNEILAKLGVGGPSVFYIKPEKKP